MTHEETMKLRDEFAAAALQGLLTGMGATADKQPAHTAKQAYELADAMLAERTASQTA